MALVDLTKDLSNFKYTDYDKVDGAVDFIPNVDAQGFTKNFDNKDNSQFVGVNGLSYTYPNNKGLNLTFDGQTPAGVNFLSGVSGNWGPGTLPEGFTINQTNSLLVNGSDLTLPTLRHNIDQVFSTSPYGGFPAFEINTDRYDERIGSQFNTELGEVYTQSTTEKLHSSYNTSFHISGFNRGNMYIPNATEPSIPTFKDFTRGSAILSRYQKDSPNFNTDVHISAIPYELPQITATGPQVEHKNFNNTPISLGAHGSDFFTTPLINYSSQFSADNFQTEIESGFNRGNMYIPNSTEPTTPEFKSFTRGDSSLLRIVHDSPNFGSIEFQSTAPYQVKKQYNLPSNYSFIGRDSSYTTTTNLVPSLPITHGVLTPITKDSRFGDVDTSFTGDLTFTDIFGQSYSGISSMISYNTPRPNNSTGPGNYSGWITTNNFTIENQLGGSSSPKFGNAGFNGGNKYGDTVKFNSSLLGKDEIYQSQLDSFGDSGQVPLTLGYNQNKATINQIWEKGNSHYSNASAQAQFGTYTNQTDTDELERRPGGLGSRGDEIDEQYKFRTTKVKSTSLSFGRHGDFGEFGAPVDGSAIFGFDMPYIKDKINGINFSHKGLTIELVRGGIVTQVARTLKDTIRLGKFILSPKGVLSVAKQVGLNLLNARPETRTYNPLSLGSSVPLLHIDRHLELPQNPLSKQVAGVNIGKTTGIKYTDAKDYRDDSSISDPLGLNFNILSKTSRLSKLTQWYMTQYVGTTDEVGIPGFAGYELGQSDGAALTGAINTVFTTPSMLAFLTPGGKGQVGAFRSRDVQSNRHMTGEVINKNNNSALIDKYTTLSYGMRRDEFSYEETLQSPSELLSRESNPLTPSIKAAGDKADFLDRVREPGYEKVRDIGNQGSVVTPKLDAKLGLYQDINTNNSADQINLHPYGDTSEPEFSKDLVDFRFKDVINKKFISFRAILGTITDTMSPEWNAERYLGRPDKVHTYMGTDRNISFDFKVYPKTKQELITLWDKLNFLVGLTYPTIRRGGFTNGFRQIAPYIEMTMGNMFRNTPGYLSSLTLTADETSTWETDDGFQLPKFIQASAEFVYIGNYVPSTTSKHYELNWLQDSGFSIGADGTQTFGVFGTYDPVVHDRPPRHGLDVVWKDQVGITTPDAPTKNVVTTEPTDTTATTTEG
tara:strand:- start:3523 stop:7017 length:3495 start_codon:yes stop_codon:yes gene_type:complete